MVVVGARSLENTMPPAHAAGAAGREFRRPASDAPRGCPFAPANVQTAGVDLDLAPLQIAQLGSSKPVPVGQQDHGGAPVPVATVLASGFDQLLDLATGEIAPGADN